MQSKVGNLLALALVLGGISIAMGQQDPQGADEKQKNLHGQNETDRAKRIDLFKLYNGKLVWPKSLQGSAFNESREQLSALMRTASKSVNSGDDPDSATLNDLQHQHRKMRDILASKVSEMKPEEYIEASRYLKEVGQIIRALQDPNLAHHFSGVKKAMGKAASPEKSKLEEMLAEALKNNPDIRVATAKLAMAVAELNRTRIQVTQEIVRFHSLLQSQDAEIKRWTSECERLAREVERSVVAPQVLEASRQQLKKAKAKRAELEAQMAAVLGLPVRLGSKPETKKDEFTFEFSQDRREFRIIRAVVALDRRAAGPMADKIRKALQTPVKVDYKDMTFEAIFKDLTKKVPGLSFRNRVNLGGNEKVNLRFEETLPVSAVLQALADDNFVSFYVREYGILATTEKAVPRGAMTVEEFLRQKPAEK